MSEYWSLVVFTLLGQAAAGIMLLLALRDEKSARMTWLALILLAVAAVASMAHLSRPWLSFYTIANVGSSWLSREIVGCLATGACMIACLIWKKRWLYWLSALVGLIFIWTMSMVYVLPTEPAWNTPVTFWRFISSGVLLGATLLLLFGKKEENGKPISLLNNWLPFIVILAMTFSVIFVFTQSGLTGVGKAQIACVALLIAGGGIGMMALMRMAGKDRENSGSLLSPGLKACAAFSVGLIWLGEIFGRVSFYNSYVWFGM